MLQRVRANQWEGGLQDHFDEEIRFLPTAGLRPWHRNFQCFELSSADPQEGVDDGSQTLAGDALMIEVTTAPGILNHE